MFTFTAQLSIAKCHLVKKQNVHFEYVSGGRFIRLIQTQNTVLSIDFSPQFHLKSEILCYRCEFGVSVTATGVIRIKHLT